MHSKHVQHDYTQIFIYISMILISIYPVICIFIFGSTAQRIHIASSLRITTTSRIKHSRKAPCELMWNTGLTMRINLHNIHSANLRPRSKIIKTNFLWIVCDCMMCSRRLHTMCIYYLFGCMCGLLLFFYRSSFIRMSYGDFLRFMIFSGNLNIIFWCVR